MVEEERKGAQAWGWSRMRMGFFLLCGLYKSYFLKERIGAQAWGWFDEKEGIFIERRSGRWSTETKRGEQMDIEKEIEEKRHFGSEKEKKEAPISQPRWCLSLALLFLIFDYSLLSCNLLRPKIRELRSFFMPFFEKKMYQRMYGLAFVLLPRGVWKTSVVTCWGKVGDPPTIIIFSQARHKPRTTYLLPHSLLPTAPTVQFLCLTRLNEKMDVFWGWPGGYGLTKAGT